MYCANLWPFRGLGLKVKFFSTTSNGMMYHTSRTLGGTEVQRLEPHGQMKLEGRWWQVCEALAGEAVRLERVMGGVLVHYCQTLVREIDLVEQRSTTAEKGKGCDDKQSVKVVAELYN
jgi:hypothetical protein